MCSIHKDEKRPKVCSDYPLFLVKNYIIAADSCPAVNEKLLDKYLDKLEKLGFKRAQIKKEKKAILKPNKENKTEKTTINTIHNIHAKIALYHFNLKASLNIIITSKKNIISAQDQKNIFTKTPRTPTASITRKVLNIVVLPPKTLTAL